MLPRPFWIFLDDLSPTGGPEGERILGALLLEEGAAEGRLRLHPVRGSVGEGWQAFLLRLKEDERVTPALFCCTGAPDVTTAIRTVYPDAPIQISLPHRLSALGPRVHPHRQRACLAEARRIFAAPDRARAVLRFRQWRDSWLSRGEPGVRTLEEDLAWCLTFYRFPRPVRRSLRSLRMLRLATRAAARASERAPASLQAPGGIEAIPPFVALEGPATGAAAPAPPPAPASISELMGAWTTPPDGSPGAPDPGVAAPSPAGSDQVLVLVDELIADPTFARWLAQYGRDRLRLAQTASAVASAITLAARIIARGH